MPPPNPMVFQNQGKDFNCQLGHRDDMTAKWETKTEQTKTHKNAFHTTYTPQSMFYSSDPSPELVGALSPVNHEGLYQG